MSAGTNRLVVYALLALVGLLGAASDAVVNQWARTGRAGWLVASWVAWSVVATLVGLVLKQGYFGFGAGIVLFLLVNSGGALILDRALFHGRVSGVQWVGVALALAAMACIEVGRDHGAGQADAAVTSASTTAER